MGLDRSPGKGSQEATICPICKSEIKSASELNFIRSALMRISRKATYVQYAKFRKVEKC